MGAMLPSLRVVCWACGMALAIALASAIDVATLDSADLIEGRRGGAAVMEEGTFAVSASNRAGNSERWQLEEDEGRTVESPLERVNRMEQYHKGESKRYE